MDIVAALKTQYHASLAMLKQAIEDCPDDLWIDDDVHPSYWRIAYHTLFFTHLYLMHDHKSFTPWDKEIEHAADLGPQPWPDGYQPPAPNTKAEMLEYWAICDGLVDEMLPQLDLSAPLSGFYWYDPLPKLDHQINNIRHIQHHLAILSDRLRAAVGRGVDWKGMA